VLELVLAASVMALVGLSLFLEVKAVLGLGLGDLIAICLAVFLAHELAHKLCARHLASGGRFKFTIAGSLITLLAAGVQNLIGIYCCGLEVALATGTMPYRIVPYRFLATGTVVVRGRHRKEVLGSIALAGPVTSLGLGWLSFLLARVLRACYVLLMVFSALAAYMAFTALMPLAFCDGLPIYWWSRRAWATALTLAVSLMVMSNVTLYLGL